MLCKEKTSIRTFGVRVVLCASSLILLLSASVTGQIGGVESDPDQGIGSRGNARNTIQGSIHFPSGRKLDRRLQVRITGATGGNLFTMTDDNGSFTFRRLAGGKYFIIIDAGREFEPVQETVDIIDPPLRSQSGQTITIQIQLRYLREAIPPPGVVDASLLSIPKPALELYGKALKAAEKGDGKGSVKLLKSALAIHPQFMLAYNELGVQYLRLNQLDDAVKSLRTAIEIAPDAFTPRLNYGIALLQRKQFPESVAELRRALELKDGSALAQLYLGRALLSTGDYAQAEKEFRRAVELGGDDVVVARRYLAAIYIEMGENERALKELEEYMRLNPKAKDADQIREIMKKLRVGG